MQPIPHMSAGRPYCFSTSMTSGGRYHLDITWLERHLFFLSRIGLSSLRVLPILCLFIAWLSFLNYFKLETVKLNLLLVVFGVLKLVPNDAMALLFSSRKGVLLVCCEGNFCTCLFCITSELDARELVPAAIVYIGSTLEKPKSHSFTWQSESMRMLAGLISRWRMLQEWRKWTAQSVLYSIVMTCYSWKSIYLELLNTFLRSDSTYSITKNR